MQGTLSAGALPGLLRALYVGRKNGLLHFARGEERCSFGLRNGHLAPVPTGVEADRFAAALVRLGRLSPADLGRCGDLMQREKRRLGQALVELELMTQEQLEESLALHVREELIKVFAWGQGSYRFEEQAQPEAGEDIAQRLSTADMILEAARRVADPALVREALGDTDRVLTLSSDPLLRMQKVALSPGDGFLLSRVDGTLAAREVLALAPGSREEAEKSLFGLLSIGVVGYLPGPPKAQKVQVPTGYFDLRKLPGYQPPAPDPAAGQSVPPPAAPPPAKATPPGEGSGAFKRLTGRFRREAATPPQASAQQLVTPRPEGGLFKRLSGRFRKPEADAPTDAEKESALSARRQEIQSMAEGLKTKNHFEVLGIPRASNEAQVKEAYFKLAKRFHPDMQREPALKDLAGAIEAVFIRIGEAYDTLRNPRTRASYEERLGRHPTPPTAGTAPPASAPPHPPSQPARPAAPTPPVQADPTSPQVIEQAVRQAERLLAQEKYWDVIQTLEPHLEAAKGRLRARAQLTIAKAYLKNPNWVKRGEEELQKVVQTEPGNVEALLLLANIYKTGGLKARAVAMLKKVLEVKPDHLEAAHALAELGVSANERIPTPPGSFLKKLFKKN
jgi:tetratricopeptide (TPR) repeat protein